MQSYFTETKYYKRTKMEVVITPKSDFRSHHVNAAQILIKQRFPKIGGLIIISYSVSYSSAANYPKQKKDK